ncbi:MAG: pseudouridine synthase [Planctomycetaceae bacterium]
MAIENRIPVLYQDEQLVAVAKPSGMFVHRSAADRSATELVVQLLRDQLNCYVYPIHRLDRPTSGVLLLAKSSEAAATYAKMFADRQVHKTYVALVRGFAPESGCIDRPLVSDKGRGRPATDPHAIPQDAETLYRTLERFELPFPSGQHQTMRCSLVEARPQTGRYHQIRRHLAGISYPVIGDADHGDTKINRVVQQQAGVTRLMLAAIRIEFVHPVTGTDIIIECPPEDSFSKVINSLRARSVLSAVPLTVRS